MAVGRSDNRGILLHQMIGDSQLSSVAQGPAEANGGNGDRSKYDLMSFIAALHSQPQRGGGLAR